MVKSGDLVKVFIYTNVADKQVEQRTICIQKGMNIKLDDGSIYTVGKDGKVTHTSAEGKTIRSFQADNLGDKNGIGLTASEYAFLCGVAVSASENLPENKGKDSEGNPISFVLSEDDLAFAYEQRHEEKPTTQLNINNAAGRVHDKATNKYKKAPYILETVHNNDAEYKVTPNKIEVVMKPSTGDADKYNIRHSTSASIFMNKENK